MSAWSLISYRPHRRLLAGLIAILMAASPALAGGQAVQYEANLLGSEEVPPVTAAATGTFTAVFDVATGSVHWTLSVPQITEATAAHIHVGARGVNGPIVVDLLGMPAAPLSSIDIEGTATAADLVGPLAGDPAGFALALQEQRLYVNVHTTAHPPGEIRGQIVLAGTAPAPPAAPPAAPPPPAPAGSLGPLPADGDAGLAMLMAALTAALLAGARSLTGRCIPAQ